MFFICAPLGGTHYRGRLVLACVCKTATLQHARLLQRFVWSAFTSTSDNMTTCRLLILRHVNSWHYSVSNKDMTGVHTPSAEVAERLDQESHQLLVLDQKWFVSTAKKQLLVIKGVLAGRRVSYRKFCVAVL